MSEKLRDTQFAGFAKRLWDELPDVPKDHYEVAVYDKWSEACEKIIAQCAYDLAQHVLQCNGIDPGYWDRASNVYKDEIMASLTGIPDLIELPKEQ